ncbi:MAG: DUF2442 domain-containing protein [Verrucomicrobia bacterium]|nr:DUF2442 domain-containing protein [Verrucomicrobiota bacterium]
MPSVYLTNAYIKDYKIHLTFKTGESGEVDLKDVIYRFKAAESLRDTNRFSKFYPASWPTLAWDCGFDIAPESLYYRVTGKTPIKPETV